MNNLFGYKYFAATAAGLVLLLFFAVLIGSVLKRSQPETTVSLTPAPTGFNSAPGGFEGEPAPTLSDDESPSPQKNRLFTADQLERLKKFDDNVPYYSHSFDIDYSKLLDQYFVALKEPDANTAFDTYLKTANMLDIRNQYRDMFVLGTSPVFDQINKAEKAYIDKQSTSQ